MSMSRRVVLIIRAAMGAGPITSAVLSKLCYMHHNKQTCAVVPTSAAKIVLGWVELHGAQSSLSSSCDLSLRPCALLESTS